jgi:sulfur carrier protein
MRVIINGKPEEVAGSTVLDVLKAKDMEPQMVAVELNSKMLERDELASTPLQDGDAIELLFYMGGGAA